MAIETAAAPLPLGAVPLARTAMDRYIASNGPSVIAEFPMPSPYDIPRFDPYYEFFSRHHWRPLINGYSGYHSQGHVEVVEAMQTFPDDASIALLRKLNVRFIVVHEHLYEAQDFADLMLRIARRSELVPHGRFPDWRGDGYLFELRR